MISKHPLILVFDSKFTSSNPKLKYRKVIQDFRPFIYALIIKTTNQRNAKVCHHPTQHCMTRPVNYQLKSAVSTCAEPATIQLLTTTKVFNVRYVNYGTTSAAKTSSQRIQKTTAVSSGHA